MLTSILQHRFAPEYSNYQTLLLKTFVPYSWLPPPSIITYNLEGPALPEIMVIWHDPVKGTVDCCIDPRSGNESWSWSPRALGGSLSLSGPHDPRIIGLLF